jgi:hypothetical protein
MEQQQQATFDSDALCSSIVKEGHQCKNKPIILVENDEFFFCWIHWSIWYKEKHGCTTTPEPWELLGFKESPDDTKLENKTILDIRSLLRKGPGDSKKGFIYIFKSHLKDDLDMFKIGYTCEESVEKRTNKWDGSILLKSWKVSHAVFAESLIHLYLQHWRCYRFVLYASKQPPAHQKRYISVWYDSPTTPVLDNITEQNREDWIPDNIYESLVEYQKITSELDIKKKKHRYKYEKEWFFCQFEYIKKIIEDITTTINNYKEDQTKWFNAFK